MNYDGEQAAIGNVRSVHDNGTLTVTTVKISSNVAERVS